MLAPLVAIAGSLNSMPAFWSGYDTSMGPGVFVGLRMLSWFVSQPLTEYVSLFIGLAFAAGVYRAVFPNEVPLLGWAGCEQRGGVCEAAAVRFRAAWGDALIVGTAITGIALGVIALADAAPQDWFPKGRSVRDSAPIAALVGSYSTAVPALKWLTGSVELVPITLIAVAIGRRIYVRWLRGVARLSAATLCIAGVVIVLNVDASADPAQTIVASAIAVMAVVWAVLLFARHIAGNNIATYVAVAVVGELLPETRLFIENDGLFMRANAAALYLAVLVLFALGVWLRFDGEEESAGAASVR
ncbi:MAG: hypothetical protein FJY92_09760 [Candidatus Hydrogenedentes bacterium]|nr:hypothetical protein [Candidatus Hydrogenedentota bacterium]